MIKVNEQTFRLVLERQLGDSFERALMVFQGYGKHLSYQVYYTMMFAVAYGEVPNVLAVLEEHFDIHLYFQHPEIRGLVTDSLLGVNETLQLFSRIHLVYFK